jgi:undecaprenyl-diphosphatase
MEKLVGFDQKLLIGMNKLAGKSSVADFIIVLLAQYFVYLIPLSLIIMWFWPRYDNIYKLKEQKNLISAFLSAIFSWLAISQPLIYVFHRARPDNILLGHKELFFHRPTFAFPSDHASMLFGLTFYLYFAGEHKKAHFFLALSVIICVSRIIAGVHFPFDIIAGLIIGLIIATLVRLLNRYLEPLSEKLIKFLKKYKLA